MKLVIAIALLSLLDASAQPFALNGTFSPRLTEIAQRRAINYTG